MESGMKTVALSDATLISAQITENKMVLRIKLTRYREHTSHFDCGGAISQYLNPQAAMLAADINKLAEWLKANDPEFPTAWSPL